MKEIARQAIRSIKERWVDILIDLIIGIILILIDKWLG